MQYEINRSANLSFRGVGLRREATGAINQVGNMNLFSEFRNVDRDTAASAAGRANRDRVANIGERGLYCLGGARDNRSVEVVMTRNRGSRPRSGYVERPWSDATFLANLADRHRGANRLTFIHIIGRQPILLAFGRILGIIILRVVACRDVCAERALHQRGCHR